MVIGNSIIFIRYLNILYSVILEALFSISLLLFIVGPTCIPVSTSKHKCWLLNAQITQPSMIKM